MTLLKYYGKDKLYTLLDAWKVKGTKEVSKDLQQALLDVWLDDKNTPLEAFQYIILGSKLKNKNLIQVLGSQKIYRLDQIPG